MPAEAGTHPHRLHHPVKSDLNNVTVCAADCATPALAARALRISTALCGFGDAILFSDTPVPSSVFRHVAIAPLRSRDDYSRFVLRDLAQHIHTSHVLVIQWDGYVVEPRAWRPEFLQYDWIGARWPFYRDGMAVGNGGFSLRSRRLLEITASPAFALVPGANEDELVCRTSRPALVRDFGIRFAPDEVADRFAYEHAAPGAPTFGFHALFNMWRHVEDAEMTALATCLTDHMVRSTAFAQLLASYLQVRRFGPLVALYGRWREVCSVDEMRSQIRSAGGSAEFTESFLGSCAAAAASLAPA